jgi:hypothetical protein
MSTPINTHPKMLDEILASVNTSENVIKALQSAFNVPYVRLYMESAVNGVWTTLDTSTVPVKQYDYHRSMAGASLLNRQTVNIFEQILMTPSVSLHAKKTQYKALSEMLYKGESDILNAVLYKSMVNLYPNLTIENISAALNNTQ